jgi:hypothetical protein
MLHQAIRIAAFALGVFLFLAGILVIGVGGDATFAGIESLAFGSILMIASVLQRSGYRSEAAEREHTAPGPGGGEPDYLEPRFLPTNEVFIDPTSRLLMRVYEDPRTAERRYRAEPGSGA